MKALIKSSVLLAFLSAFMHPLNAQTEIIPQKTKRVNYYCEVNGGYLAGAELRGLFHVKNGLSFGKHISASLGMGLETYVPGRYIPIFLEGRYKILSGKTSPFISISAGYLQGTGRTFTYSYPESKLSNGFSTGAKIGFQHGFTTSLSIISSIGWRYAYARHETYNYYLPSEPNEMSYEMNRFELTIGIIFK